MSESFSNMPRLKISKATKLGFLDRVRVGLKLLVIFTMRPKEPIKLEVEGSGSFVIVDSMEYLELVHLKERLVRESQGLEDELVPSCSAVDWAEKIIREYESLPDLTNMNGDPEKVLGELIKTYTDKELHELYGADAVDPENL